MRALLRVTFATVIAAGVALAAALGFAQMQQKFPSKPIRLVVGFPAGSQTDTVARMIGQKMSESWKQPVVMENRPGAAGTIGTGMVAKAAPDGYTLLMASASFSVTALRSNLPYDPLKDFAGVTHIRFATPVVVVAPALGVKSVKDLVALAKAQPGKIIFDLPDIKERLQAVGIVPAPTTPEEYDKILRGQIDLLSKLVRDAGLLAR